MKNELEIPITNLAIDHIDSIPLVPNMVYFRDLEHLNLNLTNACNLNCSYCYEQHRKDYGKWTIEMIDKAYDFLLTQSPNKKRKTLQFFGGEPLIHKKLILEYLAKYEDKLLANPNIDIGITTNGIMLDKEFLLQYYSYPFTKILFSFDSFNGVNDNRIMSPSQRFKVNENLLHLINSKGPFAIRTTICKERVDFLLDFGNKLLTLGARNMVIHPLTLSKEEGYIVWSEEEWETLTTSILKLIDDGMNIEFSEGVGTIGDKTNCLVGSDMLAIDASGDFSGCYFFTNLKEGLNSLMLGNLFKGVVYHKRYEDFTKLYQTFLESKDPKCVKCDLNGFCYQCPAGNANTGDGSIFRSDDMCQKITSFYLMIKSRANLKLFNNKLEETIKTFESFPHDKDLYISRAVQLLYYYKVNKQWAPNESLMVDLSVDYETLIPKLKNVDKPRMTLLESLDYDIEGSLLVREAYALTMLHFL